jgi:hypothetical protein
MSVLSSELRMRFACTVGRDIVHLVEVSGKLHAPAALLSVKGLSRGWLAPRGYLDDIGK